MNVRTPQKSRSNSPIIIEHQQRSYNAFGYRSASTATSEGRTYTRYPGSTYDERDRLKLIAQSRDFMRNNAIYKGMIERMVAYIVGNGFMPQVSGVSETQVNKIEKLWKRWFRRPEIRNLLSGSKVSRMILREMIVAGDTAVLKTDKSLIQLFEAEQLASHKSNFGTDIGIKTDDLGRPVEYRLCPWKNYAVNIAKGKDYKAEFVLFLSNPERPSQLRGVPACQSAFPMLHRINDVCDSEAIAWQLLSRIAVSVTREGGPSIAQIESKEDENKSSDEMEGDLARRVSELDYALLFHGDPGDEIKGIERNIPGLQFSESLRMFLRLLGLPLGLPLELILLDWTQSNYSQSRAVLEQAYENFVGWQAEIIDGFYVPLFDWKLNQWAKDKETNVSAGAIEKIELSWVTPTFPWIDQLKEAQAYGEQLDRGLITHTEVCKSRHSDRDEIVARRDREIRDAIERAARIKEDTDVEVPWEIFAGLKFKKENPKSEDDQSQSDKREEK